jgi:predicted P-loop ATPase
MVEFSKEEIDEAEAVLEEVQRGERAESASGDEFIKDDSNRISRGHPYNIKRAIRLLHVNIGLNQFSTETEIAGLDSYGPELTDAGAIRLRFLIEETFDFLPPKAVFEDVLIDIAHANRFHPVRDWLDGLAWDGTPRIDTWLKDYGGAEDTPFNRAVGRIFLLAGVRRVRRPGCKFDTMLILESPQGRDKSKSLRALAVKDEWFTDNLPLAPIPRR